MAGISTTIKINDAFSGALDKLSAGLNRAQGGFKRLKGAMNGNSFSSAEKSSGSLWKSMASGVVVGNLIGQGMGLAASGVRSMVTELNNSSKSWQTFEGNLRQLNVGQKEISSAKLDMQKYAQATIYSASDMASTYAQLRAVGIKNTGKLVKGFGGLAAAAENPAQAMKTLSQQATQMAAKPYAQWQDFKLMVEQSPAGMAAVAKTMGTDLQGLIQKIQDGKVKSSELLDAIAKTGTNSNFSKMATQYKTVDQAMDGLRETLASKLQPQFDKLSKVGIKAISGLADKVSSMNWDALGDGIINAINKVKPIISNIGNMFKQMFEGFTESGAGQAIGDMFNHIADAVNNLTGNLSKSKGGTSIFKELGKFTGSGIAGAAKLISSLADVVGKLDPNSIKALAVAFGLLKMNTKGLVITGVVALFNVLSKLDPGTLKALAKALGAIALAIAGFKMAKKIDGALDSVKNMYNIFKGLKKPKLPVPDVPEMPKTPNMPDTGKPGKILQNAGAYLKLGSALIMVGGAVLMVGAGFKLLADTANQLASSGTTTMVVFGVLIGLIIALGIAVAVAGSSMIAGAVGFLMFGAALLLIGAAIFIASAGIAMLATQLPLISQYGISAAVGLLALAGAIAVFGIAAIIGAVGLIALGIALVVVAVGFAVAAIGALLLGIALMILGVGAIVAAVGMLLLGVGLALVAAFSMIAAVGLIMMGVGLMLIMITAMIAAIGLMLLSVALILIAPLSLLTAVGLLLLGVALMIVAVGMAMVAAAAMAMATAFIFVGVAVMMMVTFFIMAGTMMVQAITSAMSSVVSAVRSGIQRAVSAVKGFVGQMASAGADLVNGLINGIKSMIGRAVSIAQELGSKVVGAVKGLLHIGSPSKLMRKYGRWFDEGLIIGLNDYANKAANASGNMAQGVVDAATGLNASIGMGISTSPGDMIADGFNRALGAVQTVSSAINAIDGSKADIGINGTGLGRPSIGSSSITPQSFTGGYNTSNTANNRNINIAQGAIVVNSTGNPDYDVDQMLTALEDRILETGENAF